MPGEYVGIDPLQLTRIVTSAVVAFQTHEVVTHIAHLRAILAVNVAGGASVGRWHRLHSHGGIKESKILSHVVSALLAERARVLVAAHVHREAAQVHYVPAF